MSLETLDIGIIRSNDEVNPTFEKSVERVGLPQEKFTLEKFAFENPPHHDFDTIFALLGEEDHLPEYMEQVAKMKLVCHVPTVVAVVPKSKEIDVKSALGRFPADMVLTTPVDDSKLTNSLQTLMAVHDLEARRSQRFKNKKPLGSILVENEIISSFDLSRALEYAESEKVLIGQALIELGLVTEKQMVFFLGAQKGIPVASPSDYANLEKEAAELIPEAFASHNLCIPFKEEFEHLHVILSDPRDLQLLDRLRDITEKSIIPYIGIRKEILTAINKIYGKISTDAETTTLFEQSSIDFSPVTTLSEQVKEDENDEGIIKLVKIILENATKERASDIHIEPRESELVIRYRIDGELYRKMTPPLNSSKPLIVRLKIMANLDIAERRLPQDGRFVIVVGEGRKIDARLSILPTVFGEKAVIRILDNDSSGKELTQLGFNQDELKILKTQIAKPYGLVVVTGPTGSGKTTTLYSLLKELSDDSLNIISVEDPVEYTMDNVSQVQVNNTVGLTFAKALRSILRQDPDVVMIGEIRDAETADIAVKMALTGHLVFATLHTNDAASAITRFVNIGVPPLLLSSCLNLIIAQRLVKRVCPNCKVESSDEQRHLKQLLEKENETFYRGKGCVNCNSSGYNGRVGIYEMIEVTENIRELILDSAPEIEVVKEAQKGGMKTLYQAGLEQARNGNTTIEQVMAFKLE